MASNRASSEVSAELHNPFIQGRSLGVPTARVGMVSTVASSACSMTNEFLTGDPGGNH